MVFLAFETPFLASKVGEKDTQNPNSHEARLFPFLATCLPDFTILARQATTAAIQLLQMVRVAYVVNHIVLGHHLTGDLPKRCVLFSGLGRC
jgi:hypothetical protein